MAARIGNDLLASRDIEKRIDELEALHDAAKQANESVLERLLTIVLDIEDTPRRESVRLRR